MARADTYQDQTLAYPASEFQNLQYRNTAGEWINIPGIEGCSLDGTAAPSREIVSANTATQQKIGRTRVGTITCEAMAVPQDVAWRFLRKAYREGTLVHFRYETNADLVFKSDSGGAEVNITAAGALTFDAGGDQAAPTIDGDYGLGRGAVIHHGSNNYIITNVNNGVDTPADRGKMTVAELPDYKTSSLTEKSDQDEFEIYNPPGVRWEFRAYVSQGADFSLAAESTMTTTLILIPKREVVDPTIIIP